MRNRFLACVSVLLTLLSTKLQSQRDLRALWPSGTSAYRGNVLTLYLGPVSAPQDLCPTVCNSW